MSRFPTPTPWTAELFLGEDQTTPADGAHAVACVNSHDDLVSALKYIARIRISAETDATVREALVNIVNRAQLTLMRCKVHPLELLG